MVSVVAVLWGCTNPYPKRSTEGIEHVKREIKFHQFLADVKFLFLNIKSGSLVYYFTLATTGAVGGMVLTMVGITLCIVSPITEPESTGQQNGTQLSPYN
ncbi:transmembrane protein 234-like [Oncorhynchus tshawytscha]|uniref:transmembrane protein 234-like n=1 Tax=Oncorhynchus tshawytscha TaxID=74940 RepID=UPI000D0A4EA8|nr:transmembrane protein 234-like [Oncorhynchus tshawytscha]